MLVFRRNSERRKDIYCFARYTSPATGRSSFISNITPRFSQPVSVMTEQTVMMDVGFYFSVKWEHLPSFV